MYCEPSGRGGSSFNSLSGVNTEKKDTNSSLHTVSIALKVLLMLKSSCLPLTARRFCCGCNYDCLRNLPVF